MASAACHRLQAEDGHGEDADEDGRELEVGDSHVKKRLIGVPCLSESAMYSTPPGSTVATLSPYSPSRTGTWASTS